jgi:LPXTG-motif cell wall-anchored protein
MNTRRTLLAGLAAAATIVVAPAAVSASSTDPYADGDTPYQSCEYDPSLPADSPECFPPCQYDDSIPADDPYCEEPTTTTSTTTTSTTMAPTTTSTTAGPTTTVSDATTSSIVVAAPAAPADPPAVLGQSGRLPAADPQLPATGGDQTLTTALIALAFVAGGGALMVATRRKQSA